MSNGENDSSLRVEKSLALLTTKFVSLLQRSKDGVLDLNLVLLHCTVLRNTAPAPNIGFSATYDNSFPP